MNDKNYFNNLFFNLDNLFFKDLLEKNTPWISIAGLSDYLKKMLGSERFKGNYKNRNDVFVGVSTFIHPSVEISGAAVIGKNCVINHAAFLREGCIIGDGVNIGHASEIKHSIILNDARSAHLNYIGDSIIGNFVNFSGGAIVANYRLDHENVSIKTSKGKINSGLEKFGAAVGDNSIIGVNSVLNPGTLLGKNSKVFPLTSVTGAHKNDEVIK